MKRYRHYTKDKAIILSCFGSVIEEQKYIDLKNYIEKEFDGIDIFISFSSRTIIKKLAKKGKLYKNLAQTLADLDMLGYKNIIVSSVNLFPTVEHQVVKKTVDGFKLFSLSNIRVSDAILTKSKDTTKFLISLNEQISKKDVANLFIIHGTPKLELSGIAAMDYCESLLKKLNPLNFSCSLEGANPFYALSEFFLKVWKKNNIQKVQIIPMLLVSGNHFDNDIVEIKKEINRKNIVDMEIVSSITKSEKFNLLELELIKKIIIDNIKEELKKLG